MTSAQSRVVLLLLFVGSGCAALIYEIVWFQLLELFIGSSAVSIGVLLGTFMGGMCLGSLLLPRLVSAQRHPLRVYAVLELAIGFFGILLPAIMPFVGRLYTSWGGYGITGFLLRGLVAAICLLPPTFAMGATLPAVARAVARTQEGIAWLGLFYAGNIAGAVLGCLFAGFYLLRVYDMTTATFVAAGINGGVAALGFALAAVTPSVYSVRLTASAEATAVRKPDATGSSGRAAPVASGVSRPRGSARRQPSVVYIAIAVSGFCALASEVIWTRILALAFGATVYTFSIILAVFLIGLGLGSSLGSVLTPIIVRPRVALGWCQILLVGAMAWTAYMLSSALPYWPIIYAVSPHIRYNFQLDFAHTLWAILPAPVLWGASFPLALASAHAALREPQGRPEHRRGTASSGLAVSKVEPPAEEDPARVVGRVYAANTVGAILGALGASLLLVAWLGSQRAQQVIMTLSALAGLLVLMWPATSEPKRVEWPATSEPKRVEWPATRQEPGRERATPGWAPLVALPVAAWLVLTVAAIPGVLVAYGRNSASWVGHTGEILYVGEGLNSSVAVSRLTTGVLTYHNAGKIQASSQPQDMRLQRMLGHVSTLIPRSPRRVLVIGCGSGITAGAASVDPKVERQTIVEIEGLVPRVVSTYFGPQNFEVVSNPKVEILIDDARHYLLTSDETFDVITADPFDPWVRGAAALYTKEFLELAKARLNPGGVMTMWVPLYTTTPEAVKSQVGTFFDVFPDGLVLGNTYQTKGYDIVLIGQREFSPIDLDEIDARLRQPDYAPVMKSFGEIGFRSAADLFASYAGRATDLKPWLADAVINRDGNLRLQYLAGLGININQPEVIYQQMLRHRGSPDDVFAGSDQNLAKLRSSIK